MYRPIVDHNWKVWWYPDGTTASGYAMIIRIQKKETEHDN